MDLFVEKSDPGSESIGGEEEEKEESGLFCQKSIFEERAERVGEKMFHVRCPFRTKDL